MSIGKIVHEICPGINVRPPGFVARIEFSVDKMRIKCISICLSMFIFYRWSPPSVVTCGSMWRRWHRPKQSRHLIRFHVINHSCQNSNSRWQRRSNTLGNNILGWDAKVYKFPSVAYLRLRRTTSCRMFLQPVVCFCQMKSESLGCLAAFYLMLAGHRSHCITTLLHYTILCPASSTILRLSLNQSIHISLSTYRPTSNCTDY